MKIVIVGFGTAGKHYYELLKKKQNKDLYIVDKLTLPVSKNYRQISFNFIEKKKFSI